MPELPEVEVTRRRIAPVLLGREIADLITTPPSRFFLTPPAILQRRLVGRRLTELTRHGKYLLGTLDDGSRLLLHLGMSGQLVSGSARSPRLLRVAERAAAEHDGGALAQDPHVHLRFAFADGGEQVRFRDPRRFGRVEWLAVGATSPRLERLGVDALEIEPAALHALVRRRRAPIKALLLDQAVLAGVGNIYADEALFRARLRPRRPGARVSAPATARLVAALRQILERSIVRGGTSISDFVAPDGADGAFTAELAVYGRDGQPCPTCATPIRRVVIAGRSSHFCPRCQR